MKINLLILFIFFSFSVFSDNLFYSNSNEEDWKAYLDKLEEKIFSPYVMNVLIKKEGYDLENLLGSILPDAINSSDVFFKEGGGIRTQFNGFKAIKKDIYDKEFGKLMRCRGSVSYYLPINYPVGSTGIARGKIICEGKIDYKVKTVILRLRNSEIYAINVSNSEVTIDVSFENNGRRRGDINW